MTRCTRTSYVAGLLLLSITAPGIAQDMQRVEPGVGDLGPLGLSLRNLSRDLRVDTDFEDVRRSPHHPDRFIRSAGALHAVFPRSWYVEAPGGQMPLVPPGTIYRIGSASLEAALGDPSGPGAPGQGPRRESGPQTTTFLSWREDLPDLPRPRMERHEEPEEDSARGPLIVADEKYRRAQFESWRDRFLTDHAARGRSSSSSAK